MPFFSAKTREQKTRRIIAFYKVNLTAFGRFFICYKLLKFGGIKLSNGECHVGSKNSQAIKDLQRRVTILENKMDWFLYLLVATLVAVIVDIILSIGGLL